MFLATQKSLPTDVAIFAAAVADFKLQKKYKNKKINNEKLFYKKKSEISDEIVDRIIDQLN